MRQKELIQLRDRKIVERFHDLYDIKRKRIDDVLDDLSENHFFLDPKYIYSRIFYHKGNLEYYQKLNEKK